MKVPQYRALIGSLICLFVTLVFCTNCESQTTTTTTRQNPAPWRPDFTEVNRNRVPEQPAPIANNQPIPAAATPPVTQAAANNGFANPSNGQAQSNNIAEATRSFNSLPNDAGQVWREYDIRPYTARIKTSDEPEKAILDWILLETGKEMWFRPPLGILNVSRDKLYVYHTPEIHKVIQPIVDRFVYRKGEVQSLEINMVTIGNPNWRADHYSVLQPIEVPSPGVEAWMVSKENAALLLGELSKRSDFQKHGGGQIQAHDGQNIVMEKRAIKQFVRSIRWVPEQVPNYQPLLTQVNEGYSLDISCLNSIDGNTMEACINCEVDQVEKLNTVRINVPLVTGGMQNMSLQIPQIISWRLRERIRWPSDQVLLLNVGVVANPTPENNRPLPGLFKRNGQRADALLFIEFQGPAVSSTLQHAAAGGITPVAPVQRKTPINSTKDLLFLPPHESSRSCQLGSTTGP